MLKIIFLFFMMGGIPVAIAMSGAYGSVLSDDYMDMVDGLRAFINQLADPLTSLGEVTSFGAGNIILGGNGSDLLIGGGGNDSLSGGAMLNYLVHPRAVVGVSAQHVDQAMQYATSLDWDVHERFKLYASLGDHLPADRAGPAAAVAPGVAQRGWSGRVGMGWGHANL